MNIHPYAVLSVLTGNILHTTVAFQSAPFLACTRISTQTNTPTFLNGLPEPTQRTPSLVSDVDGPTIEEPPPPMEVVDITDWPEMHYDPDNYPIRGQPWRRGVTDGNEAPISAPWRKRARVIIEQTVERLGATFIDVTWYHGCVAIAVDPDSLSQVDARGMDGPDVKTIPSIKNDDGEYLNRWLDFGYLDQEREYYEERAEHDMLPMFVERQRDLVSPEVYHPVSKLTEAIHEALTEEEEAAIAKGNRDEFDVLWRHKLVIVAEDKKANVWDDPVLSVGTHKERMKDALNRERYSRILSALTGGTVESDGIIEYQKDFDSLTGFDIDVKTLTPYATSRIVSGKLIERNAFDIVLRKNGADITIPHNFVQEVKLKGNPDEDLDFYRDRFMQRPIIQEIVQGFDYEATIAKQEEDKRVVEEKLAEKQERLEQARLDLWGDEEEDEEEWDAIEKRMKEKLVALGVDGIVYGDVKESDLFGDDEDETYEEEEIDEEEEVDEEEETDESFE
eukprot:CAMPEP_0194357840 /NCGR_PEP_ID=MMETSP0174-20130528/5264_1 /TAXON_ID=216777 /ORGANISM="Proboscia alata, Strain PI-D3" /LENGTH=505 /DNA_ID=CAMNT_0039128027 /DNA_START=155 /DNA_END=1672 /DNA_ORIENTATION=+